MAAKGPQPPDRIVRFGVGPIARRRAMALADRLRGRRTPAAALFKLEYGGWVVAIYRGTLPAEPPWRHHDDAD
ncbi:hypothetical protein [Actinocatenispora comari]|jgi:hypothetical protein|uniref:Uncharacterized protein n=1 Tax=Actinocatenispora comari TaxID=2807577 RepID=A0A8J4A8V3_9ACTN|nr:hypothetical protein [Actinocatenispora comari]GIL25445.1 hypothetical protein NUM_07000 [Actinocatenispora comari]